MNDFEKIKSLSAIIPAFNEETIIEKSILLLHEKLKSIAKNYEIIVVDDGSSDRTPDILKELASKINELKFIRNDVNQGLGFSLRKAFSIASQELIFYTDADLPIDYNDIYRAVKILKETNADFLAGFRYNRYSESIYRIIYSSAMAIFQASHSHPAIGPSSVSANLVPQIRAAPRAEIPKIL